MVARCTFVLLFVVAQCVAFSCATSRGEKFFKIFHIKKAKPRSETEETVRVPRNPKWSNNGAIVIKLKPVTKPTERSTTTKSLEQILKEKEAEMRRRNPKLFLEGYNKEKNKDKELIFDNGELRTVSAAVEKAVKKMEKKLKSLTTHCLTNMDCSNKTCCMLNKDGIGTCIIGPHRLNQPCSEQCPCTGEFVCQIKDLENKKVIAVRQCVEKVVDIEKREEDFRRKLLETLRAGKGAKARGTKKLSAINNSKKTQ